MRGFPTDVSISPLRLASNYRDYWGDAHARLAELVDPILDAACYVPRYYHAPSTPDENAGLAANGGYLEYALVIKAGSFILGFLHSYTSSPSANTTDAPVTSSFKLQITDVRRNYRFFGKPVPETYLLNDQPGTNPDSSIAGGPGGGLYVLNPSVRLLTAPYPVAPPGIFRVEFWNSLAGVNKDARLTLLVAQPAEVPKS